MNNTACERKPFNILVVGRCVAGPKTLVNALLGMDVLPTKHCAYQCFPITVEFGSCEKQIQIFERGKSQQRIISREQFEKPVETYSSGQKKKLLLARSLCQKAHLYLWDEPLNYIDIFSRMQIEKMIKDSSMTMLFVEHDRKFLENVADSVISMDFQC